jgi:hypothetical protein
MCPVGLRFEKGCTGYSQQKLKTTDSTSRQRGRPTSTNPQLSKNNQIEKGKNWSWVPDGCLTARLTDWLSVVMWLWLWHWLWLWLWEWEYKCFVLCSYRLQVSTETDYVVRFSSVSPDTYRKLPQLGHDQFLLHSTQFILSSSSYHSMHYSAVPATVSFNIC